jgi:hypothetical protein
MSISVAMDKPMLFVSSEIIKNCPYILQTFSGIIYIFDVKRSVIYKANSHLHQITGVTNSLFFESKVRRNFFHLTTGIGQYVWYRLFYSILSRINFTDVAKREFLAYIDQNARRAKGK